MDLHKDTCPGCWRSPSGQNRWTWDQVSSLKASRASGPWTNSRIFLRASVELLADGHGRQDAAVSYFPAHRVPPRGLRRHVISDWPRLAPGQGPASGPRDGAAVSWAPQGCDQGRANPAPSSLHRSPPSQQTVPVPGRPGMPKAQAHSGQTQGQASSSHPSPGSL